MRRVHLASLVLAAVLLGACDDDPPVLGDSGLTPDARPLDGGADEAGPDRGLLDLFGHHDGKRLDARRPDGPRADARRPDFALPDLARPDQGIADWGTPVGCGFSPKPYGGTFCGAAGGKPCKLLRNETLPGGTAFRNHAPSVALDKSGNPGVLLSVAQGGFKGYYGARAASGAWSVGALSPAVATGGLAVEPAGAMNALVYDGAASGGQLWRLSGTWQYSAAVSPSLVGQSKGMCGWDGAFAIDRGGCLHTVFASLSSDLYYLRRKGTSWTSQTLSSTLGGKALLALAPSGVPHVFWWASQGSAGWFLYRATMPGKTETVVSLGSNTLGGENQAFSVTVTGSPSDAGTPHLLYVRRSPANKAQLAYGTRASTGAWSFAALETDGANSCTGPCTVGATCQYDYSIYRPMAAVSSGSGDVLLLYNQQRYFGTATGTRQSYPPYNCQWTYARQAEGTVWQARVKGSTVSRAQVASGVLMAGSGPASAALDAAGRVHLALYALPKGSATGNAEVRYLLIGP